MPESYQGIAIPAGSVAGLRSSATELIDHAKVLADASRQLRGMPSSGSWIGPAHGRYLGMCLTVAGAAEQGARGFVGASGAASAYADELEHAQKQAKAAIHEAQAAQRQIDHAKIEIGRAQDRQVGAQGRIDSAIRTQGMATAAGHHNAGAAAELHRAERELHDAEDDERRWKRELRDAEERLRRAKHRGDLAEQAAHDAGVTARRLFAAAGQQMPHLAPPPPPPPAKPAHPGGGGDDVGSWLAGAGNWAWEQAKAVPGGVKDATVGAASTLYHGVHDGLEYRYNSIAHPELAQREQMQQTQATSDAITHPGRTIGNMVDWNDLSHGNIGAWVGNLAPALLAGGAGPAARALRAARAGRRLDRAAVSHGAGEAAPRVGFGHGARHLVGTGLTQHDVEAAITRQVRHSVRGGKASGSFGGRLKVGGETIEYRGYGLDNGKLHVGTYYPVP